MPAEFMLNGHARDGMDVDILSGQHALSLWSGFEASATLTPYQHSAWIRALHHARGETDDMIDLLVMSRSGQTLAALPLRVLQGPGYRVAEIPGTDIGNSDWIPQRADITLSRAMLAKAFSVLSRRRGVDLIRFANLPSSWQGVPNPLLAFPHQTAPDHLYLGPIEDARSANLPKRRRGDLLRSKRRLEELVGQVSLRCADSEAEISAIHAAFIAQRNVRFRQMGISNVFAVPFFMQFFRDLGAASLAMRTPMLRFDALYAGDEILATAIGVQAGTHYSQYINSNTDGPASKYSLVGLLTFLLVEKLAEAGIRTIDMGVGDYAYKKVWAEQTPVFDLVLPLTFKGRIVSPAVRGTRSTKRMIKQNPTLWAMSRKLRSLKQLLEKNETG